MSRINKTNKNLKSVWDELDKASGALYCALDVIAQIKNLSDTIKRQADMIDITRIDMLKNEIEELIIVKNSNVNIN